MTRGVDARWLCKRDVYPERSQRLQDFAGLHRRLAVLEFDDEAPAGPGREGELILCHAERLADGSDEGTKLSGCVDRDSHVPEREYNAIERGFQGQMFPHGNF
jgi:hypothetical protein